MLLIINGLLLKTMTIYTNIKNSILQGSIAVGTQGVKTGSCRTLENIVLPPPVLDSKGSSCKVCMWKTTKRLSGIWTAHRTSSGTRTLRDNLNASVGKITPIVSIFITRFPCLKSIQLRGSQDRGGLS